MDGPNDRKWTTLYENGLLRVLAKISRTSSLSASSDQIFDGYALVQFRLHGLRLVVLGYFWSFIGYV